MHLIKLSSPKSSIVFSSYEMLLFSERKCRSLNTNFASYFRKLFSMQEKDSQHDDKFLAPRKSSQILIAKKSKYANVSQWQKTQLHANLSKRKNIQIRVFRFLCISIQALKILDPRICIPMQEILDPYTTKLRNIYLS